MAIRKVVSRSIGTDVIAAEDLAANSVTVAEIQDDAVTSAKIDSTSTGMSLADLNVDSGVLKVDATNDSVGINISNPSDYYSGSNSLVVSGGLSIKDEAGISRLEFVDGTSGSEAYVGNIVYVHSGDYMRFNAGISQRMRIDADGLKFGSDSAAANALNDYEEGTWTPTYVAAGMTVNYVGQSGYYVKVGNLVEISCQINISSVSGGSGTVSIRNLPFTQGATQQYGRWTLQTSSVNFNGGAFDMYAYPAGTTIAQILYSFDNGGWTVATTSDFVVGTGSIITMKGTYTT